MSMKVDVYCCNCREHILQTDTEVIALPLIGNMFTLKEKNGKPMEWSVFSKSSVGNDLTCPLCEWTFHEDGMIRFVVNGQEFKEKPDDLIYTVKEQTRKQIHPVKVGKVDPLPLPTEAISIPEQPKTSDHDTSNDIPDDIIGKVEGQENPTGKISNDSVVANLQDTIETGKDEKPEIVEKPELNTSEYINNSTDSESENNGNAPAGCEAAQSNTGPIVKPKVTVNAKSAAKIDAFAKKKAVANAGS